MAFCCCSVAQPCLTLCEPVDCSMPGFPVLNLFTGQEERWRHRECTCGHGGEGEKGMVWETEPAVRTPPCVT